MSILNYGKEDNQCTGIMKAMLLRFIPVLIFLALPLNTLTAQITYDLKTTFLSDNSELTIKGTSNVTDFECEYEGSFDRDTLQHSIQFDEKSYRISGDTLKLLINSFECGKRGINRDLRKTLKSSVFPTIDIVPLSFSKNEQLLNQMYVSISIAGAVNNYELFFESDTASSSSYRVKGEQLLKMTDFNIDPPRALLGLIKVDDELMILFDIMLKQI